MVVRPDWNGLVAHVRVVLDELDGGIAVVEESIRQLEVQAIARFVLQVGEGLFLGVRDAQRAAVPVARDPDHTCRIGGRATELRFLFDHQHLEARMRGRERGGKARCP